MSDQSSQCPTILQRLSWRAVLLGFAVDYGGSTVFGFVAGIIGGITHASHGGDVASAHQAMLSSTPFLQVMLTVGLLFVVMGGFVTARLAPQAGYLNAAALGVIDLLLGVTALFEGLPAWYLVIAFAATLPCALLGAFFASFFNHQEAEP